MGSSPSKEDKTIQTKSKKSFSRKQSNSDRNYTLDHQNKTQHSSSKDGTYLIKDREKGNGSDETKKEHTDHRTRENNDSNAVGDGDGLTKALPQNSTETLDVDPRSPNQIIKAEKAKKEEEKALKEEEEKPKREEIEKVRKGKEIQIIKAEKAKKEEEKALKEEEEKQKREEIEKVRKGKEIQIIKAEKAKKEEEKALKDEEEKQKREEIEKVRKGNEILQRMISSLKDQYDDSEMKYSLLKKAVTMMNTHQHKINSTEKQLFKLDKDEQKQTRLRTLRQEKANLLQRLSEIASARLRHNNPDIADLSDENRATKLAERLSELYDNEWTDLFEETKKRAGKNVDERTIAENLRDILKVCYENCQRIAECQLSNLFGCLHMDTKKDLKEPPAELRLRLKEFQKNSSHHSLKYVQKITIDGANSPIKLLKKNVVVKCSSKTKIKYNLYVNLCTEITWHMQIQDPPLVLDFGTETSEPSRFRPYTISGPQLDYILWPAMLLHGNGAIVSKGVAQFKKELKNEKLSEDSDKQHKNTNAIQDITAKSDWE
ncbi:reticulocyte-binding protein homolog 2a-like isoform X1 [Mercenaria mercenaria]|uniref:reticulocyte-binding protein homolog 2a-like isoform X1 n=1 Tax=Mercenaria mercenaria TaxID=6596 RepID=UPI00234E605B|nr:reticulocyte-binding protein homolog 2a-like isoform X1 [Mercenaria mercenaria]